MGCGAQRMGSSIAIFNALSIPLLYGSQALLDLEPSGTLYVCSGGALRVNCSTNAALLQWNITFPSSLRQRTLIRSFGVGSMLQMETVTLNFSITTMNISLTRSSPLISIVSIDNTTAEVNNSLIVCSGFHPEASASVQLSLVRKYDGNINITSILNISEHLQANSVTVTLQWSTKNGVTYAINVEPEVAVNHTGRQSAQVIVPYNMKYNVSVTASLCGDNRTTSCLLNYVKCPPLPSSSDSPVMVEGYRNPALEGTTITFSCPPQLILTGPSTSICMGNGRWQPVLSGTRCKVNCQTPVVKSNVSVNYTSTLEDSLLTFQCEDGLLPDSVFTSRCYKNGTWIPNPSNHVCTTLSAANCGDPSPPSDGYLEPYTSTLEGARVNRVHVCQNGQLDVGEIFCSSDGEWVLVSGSSCQSDVGHESMVNLLTSISSSLGSLLAVALLVCGILVLVIIVTSRKKGTAVQVSGSGVQKSAKSKHQNPEYEEVKASGNEVVHHESEELEMMKNVAYGPLQLT